MVQRVLPLFPGGTTEISESIAFSKEDGKITYFHYSLPLFFHAEDDLASFRMITSQFYINGLATQVQIQRAFGVTPISVKRSVKIYREFGPSGFFINRRSSRQPRKLTPNVLEEIQSLLNQGVHPTEISEKFNIKLNTLLKAISDGRLSKKKMKLRA